MSKFRKELTDLINTYSLESVSNTPDFILARYLDTCLYAFNMATKARDNHSVSNDDFSLHTTDPDYYKPGEPK